MKKKLFITTIICTLSTIVLASPYDGTDIATSTNSYEPNLTTSVNIVKDGDKVNWTATVDNLAASDKSLSRTYEDTLVAWGETKAKEHTENQANAVVNIAQQIASTANQMNGALNEYRNAQSAVSSAQAALENSQKQLDSYLENLSGFSVDPVTGLVVSNATAAGVNVMQQEQLQANLDKAKADLDASLIAAKQAADRVNALDDSLKGLESSMSPELSAQLYAEASGKFGNDLVSNWDSAMADEVSRAKVQKNLDSMYDKYLSSTPKLDLTKAEDRAYAKQFITAFSGQSQSQGKINNTIPEYLTVDGTGMGSNPYSGK